MLISSQAGLSEIPHGEFCESLVLKYANTTGIKATGSFKLENINLMVI